MSVRPIIFSGPMVEALLEGRKIQTRRPLEPQPDQVRDVRFSGIAEDGRACFTLCCDGGANYTQYIKVPYAPGDLLYVRETWKPERGMNTPGAPTPNVSYRADWPDTKGLLKWRPAIHMPRALARLTLEVTTVKVERLNDISRDDAVAEGFGVLNHGVDRIYQAWISDPLDEFADTWDDLYAKSAPWDSDPWVVAITFTVIEQNVDALLAEREAA